MWRSAGQQATTASTRTSRGDAVSSAHHCEVAAGAQQSGAEQSRLREASPAVTMSQGVARMPAQNRCSQRQRTRSSQHHCASSALQSVCGPSADLPPTSKQQSTDACAVRCPLCQLFVHSSHNASPPPSSHLVSPFELTPPSLLLHSPRDLAVFPSSRRSRTLSSL